MRFSMAAWLIYAILLVGVCQVTPFHIVKRQDFANGPNDGNSLSRNERPIIGILAQEMSKTYRSAYPEANYSSYIAASYVKFLEGAGARVVPIFINRDRLYYTNLLDSINGVLLPGGAAMFNTSDGYASAGAAMFDYARRLNARGDHFPVWGTCLGFELMVNLAAGIEARTACDSQNTSLPLRFKPDYFNSKLFRAVPKEVLNILSSENVTVNFHKWCVTETTLSALGLDQDWHVLSVNVDSNGLEFVSSFESRTLPFYGVQFHPEKNGYEFKTSKNIPHSGQAVQVMQFFANFFVEEARKNRHSFKNDTVEEASLIYKYSPTYTGNRTAFEQTYFFN